MIEQVVTRRNLLKARRQVEKNRGSSGVDGMPVGQLKQHLDQTREVLVTSILNHSYVAQPILGVVIPKGNGKTRQLGVPTVRDRMLQQAVSQAIAPKFEAVRRCDGVQRHIVMVFDFKRTPTKRCCKHRNTFMKATNTSLILT